MEKKQKIIIISVVIFVVIVSVVLFFLPKQPPVENLDDPIDQEVSDSDRVEKSWTERELKDVKTQEIFKISDFFGKPILVESFAVWCPVCTSQQKEIKNLHEEVGDSVVSIALDTDPNEDEARVKEHLDRNGFDWYYAVAPIEVTEALIKEFGPGIVSAPSAPVILICEDGIKRKLRNGVKNADELKKEIGKCP